MGQEKKHGSWEQVLRLQQDKWAQRALDAAATGDDKGLEKALRRLDALRGLLACRARKSHQVSPSPS
jgi:hypothetical protein